MTYGKYAQEAEEMSKRRKQQMGDLEKMYLDTQQRIADSYEQRKKAALEEHMNKQTNWLGSGLSGAQAGLAFSGGNPYGALAGGIIGTAYGQGKAISERMKHKDEGLLEAAAKTIFDVGQPFRGENYERLPVLANAVNKFDEYESKRPGARDLSPGSVPTGLEGQSSFAASPEGENLATDWRFQEEGADISGAPLSEQLAAAVARKKSQQGYGW